MSCEICENKSKTNWAEFKIAIPVALVFIFLFVWLQKAGLINLLNIKSVSLGTAFMIGLVASISSCGAVIGGLLLSMSATFAKGGHKMRPQLLFHIGRVIAFFVLGGVIGTIGLAFTLSSLATFILNIIIGLVMLVLGVNLLGVFDWTKKLHPRLPKFFSGYALQVSKFNYTLTPFLVGVATFFLPCGFTQSMQIYTLSAGGFWVGGMTMLAFALGTLPALALISFSSLGVKNNSNSGVFFKSVGLIVLTLALFNLINALVVVGLLPPIFDF